MPEEDESRIGRLVCAVRGHDWERVAHVPMHVEFNLKAVVGRCSRCGKEGTAADATAFQINGNGMPSEFIEQPPEDEIRALYEAGKIDERQMEIMMQEAFSDA